MVQAKTRFNSIEEYAALDPSDLPKGNYELVDGTLVEMGAENDQNVLIAGFLFSIFLQFVPHYLLRRGSEIAVSSETVTSRYPDLMVITEEIHCALKRNKRSLVGLDLPAPKLVIEVVSPGEPGSDNYERDYVHKRGEYAARGIFEYWVIDPSRAVVLILNLKNGKYQERAFRGSDRVSSPTFPEFEVTAEQILKAGE